MKLILPIFIILVGMPAFSVTFEDVTNDAPEEAILIENSDARTLITLPIVLLYEVLTYVSPSFFLHLRLICPQINRMLVPERFAPNAPLLIDALFVRSDRYIRPVNILLVPIAVIIQCNDDEARQARTFFLGRSLPVSAHLSQLAHIFHDPSYSNPARLRALHILLGNNINRLRYPLHLEQSDNPELFKMVAILLANQYLSGNLGQWLGGTLQMQHEFLVTLLHSNEGPLYQRVLEEMLTAGANMTMHIYLDARQRRRTMIIQNQLGKL